MKNVHMKIVKQPEDTEIALVQHRRTAYQGGTVTILANGQIFNQKIQETNMTHMKKNNVHMRNFHKKKKKGIIPIKNAD